MRLDGLKVEKFKAVGEVEIPLGHVNILVGGNGSGKSSMLQAVHLACCILRQASRVELQKTTTIGVEELDYLPTEDYKTLGHLGDWGKNQDSPYSQVSLYFTDPASRGPSSLEATCRLRSARNAGISITGEIQQALVPALRTKSKFFSSYIPGISGIPNREERKSKKVVLKACSFGDSNVILRNALLLLKEQDATSIGRIEQWIGRILRPIKIDVEHNNDVDLYVKCSVTLNGQSKPIELAGTGYIQLIQIFCYILLFSPGILLIDEPDIHLHPDVQERLVSELVKVARERDMRILLTTHSPFIVRGAPSEAKVFWLDNGKLESTNREIVELALGWGAFGKRIILLSEDSKNDLMKAILRQGPTWNELWRSIQVTAIKTSQLPSKHGSYIPL
jgi:ABC-type cobalamin/Fe3+-siderophores transport system ATPase subunit